MATSSVYKIRITVFNIDGNIGYDNYGKVGNHEFLIVETGHIRLAT